MNKMCWTQAALNCKITSLLVLNVLIITSFIYSYQSWQINPFEFVIKILKNIFIYVSFEHVELSYVSA